MKKNYFMIFLALLFATVGQAQKKYEISENSTTEILEGEEHMYVLRSGISTNSKSVAYLNSGSEYLVPNVDSTCIYSFIKVEDIERVDENGETRTFPLYVLKNQSNGMYLSDGKDKYVSNSVLAFRFTARIAKEYSREEVFNDVWAVYSHSVVDDRCAGATAANAWVLCSPSQRRYLSFDSNPEYTYFVATSNWLVQEAKELEISAFEKFTMIFDQYFGLYGVDAAYYPVGNDAGCISQAFYDEMCAVYEEAVDLTGLKDLADNVYDQCRVKIQSIFARYESEVVKVNTGYYLIKANRSANKDIAYDDGANVKCRMNHGDIDGWNVKNAKYIWEVVSGEEDGKFYLRNWATGHYWTQPEKNGMLYEMTEKPISLFDVEQIGGRGTLFYLRAGASVAHCAPNGTVKWVNNLNPGASKWNFTKIDDDTIASLVAGVAQDKMNRKLSALCNDADRAAKGLVYKNGFSFNGSYYAQGLVTEVEDLNCQESKNFPPSNLLDGNVDSYFHSRWSSELEKDDYHWIQVDLGKAVSDVYLKFTERLNNGKHRPTSFSLVAPKDDNVAAGVWTDVMAEVANAEYAYSTFYSVGCVDSTTYIEKFHFERPVQHLRFVVKETKSNTLNGDYPYWTMAEMNFFDVADCLPNPAMALVPEEVINKLNLAIHAAESELKEKMATQKTFDALENALNEFWEVYPDPTRLKLKLEEAQKIIDECSEDDEILGYYKVGSAKALQAVVDDITSKLEAAEDRALTIDEINSYRQQLKDALEVFSANLNIPMADKVYRIFCQGGEHMEKEPAYYRAVVCSKNASLDAYAKWGYKEADGLDERFNSLWYVEKSPEGNKYAFKNLANGYYLDNAFEGLTEDEIENLDFEGIGYSKSPKYFKFESGSEPGYFSLFLASGKYMEFSMNDRRLGVTSSRLEPTALLEFLELDPADFVNNYKIDLKAGEPQIITLPIDIKNVYTEQDNKALKVMGLKDNAIQLQKYAADEVIAAGTPFVIYSNPAKDDVPAEYTAYTELVNEKLESNLSMTYNYKVTVQNGMVSAPDEVELAPGFGYLYRGLVLASKGGETIGAGTGYFNADIPVVEEDGAYSLILNEPITGDETRVPDLQIVKNIAVDVYTLSGIRIRSNVKVTNATQGLPKGIYIVAGKKVVVK